MRKKSAKKSAAKKPASSETEEQLSLAESVAPSESASRDEDGSSGGRTRNPKSGVRDARRERPSDSEGAPEVVEKLVPEVEQRESRDQARNDQDQSDSSERRGRNRGRNRNRNDRNERSDRNDRREEAPRPSFSAKHLKKKAWKIFESEVTEEGLALLDDNGLREYARGSFNAARIFLEEAGRVEGRKKTQKPKSKNSDSDKDSDKDSDEKD